MPTLELLWIESLTDRGLMPAESRDKPVRDAAHAAAPAISTLTPGLRAGLWQRFVAALWRHYSPDRGNDLTGGVGRCRFGGRT